MYTTCDCMAYEPATPEKPLPPQWMSYVGLLKSIQAKIACCLVNEPELRNLNNKNFVQWYIDNIDKGVDFESIRRMKQKLVAEKPEKYGPLKDEFIVQKALKKTAVEEVVTGN